LNKSKNSNNKNSMPVAPEETLSRFALEKTYYRTSDNTAKPKAFMPDRAGNTSVFRIDNLSVEDKWNLGEENVARPQRKEIRASIELKANHVFSQELGIDPDDNPPRHANICNWPEEKSARMLKAELLASYATLYLK
jgi:hypothetical protein